jgi:ubiquinone/menaquinone biosynthesis C-methylase UbiE
MNGLENWFCNSSLWRGATRKRLLPWLTEGAALGDHLLELGAGFGAATGEWKKRVARVTSLEYRGKSMKRLAENWPGGNGGAVRGDASSLSFPDGTFSSVAAILMLHHLLTPEAQDRAFAEVRRVLRPGGIFLAFDMAESWMGRVVHIRSTFVPLHPAEARKRLGAAGFARVQVDFFHATTFRILATRG